MGDNTTIVLAVLGVLGIVAVAGLFALALSKGPSGGTIMVLDGAGNPLYTVIDSPTGGSSGPVTVFRSAPFVPV